MESVQRHLSSRLSNRLSCDNTHSLTNIHKMPAREITSVTRAANAVLITDIQAHLTAGIKGQSDGKFEFQQNQMHALKGGSACSTKWSMRIGTGPSFSVRNSRI